MRFMTYAENSTVNELSDDWSTPWPDERDRSIRNLESSLRALTAGLARPVADSDPGEPGESPLTSAAANPTPAAAAPAAPLIPTAPIRGPRDPRVGLAVLAVVAAAVT